MANVLSELFANIAAAIKETSGNNATMKPTDFPDRIRTIETDSSGYNLKLAEMLMLRKPEGFSDDQTVLNLRSFKTSDGNTLASLQSYSFAGFSYVEYMAFSDVFWVSPYVFAGCEKLKVLDFTVTTVFRGVVFNGNALNGCVGLQSVIVRDGGAGVDSVGFMRESITNNDGTISGYINATNGANDTFYVYVPRDSYDTIMANISWQNTCVSRDRFRILEDYPEVDHWNDTYTVRFYDGDTLVDTKKVKYGQTAQTSYKKEGYQITWSPSNVNITSDTDCYAQLTEA